MSKHRTVAVIAAILCLVCVAFSVHATEPALQEQELASHLQQGASLDDVLAAFEDATAVQEYAASGASLAETGVAVESTKKKNKRGAKKAAKASKRSAKKSTKASKRSAKKSTKASKRSAKKSTKASKRGAKKASKGKKGLKGKLPTDYKGLKALATKLKADIAKKRSALRAKQQAQYNKAKKNMDAESTKAAQRSSTLRLVKPYGKSIHIGNYMTGGTFAPQSPKTALEAYYARMHDLRVNTSPSALKLRRATLAKIERLYEKAMPSDATYLVETLRSRGVDVSPAKALEEWAASKNWLRQERLKEAEAEAREDAMIAQIKVMKEGKVKEEHASIEKIKRTMTALTDEEADRLSIIEDKLHDKMWLEDYPLHEEGENGADNWWGCIDCVAEKSTAHLERPSKLDSLEDKIAAAKRANMNHKKGKGKVLGAIKGAIKGAVQKGAAKLIKALGKKLPKVNGRLSGRMMGRPGKGVKVPKIDMTINNLDLIRHFLERFRLRNDLLSVKSRAEELMDRLKTKVVETMLTQQERNEMLLAKTEALEKAVAYDSGVVKIVKGPLKNYKAPKRPHWPSPNPPSSTAGPNYENQVDIMFADGFLSDNMKTEKHDLDIASNEGTKAMDVHDAFIKQHNIIRKDVVWGQFEGKGDSHQVRSNEYNAYRKKFPHQKLPDGTEPW